MSKDEKSTSNPEAFVSFWFAASQLYALQKNWQVLKNNLWEKASNCYTSTLVINLCTRLSLFAIINPTFSLLNFENLTGIITKIHA